MGTWSNEHYARSKERVVEIIRKAEKGRLPSPREEQYVVIWGKGNKRWIEFPDQIADEVWEIVKDSPVVKGIRRGEVGYHFYESAFIEISR